MELLHRRRFVTGAALVGVEVAQLVLGCASTTGKRVTIETRVRGDVEREEAFGTDLGWTVALTRAEIWIASILYFEGAPVAGRFEGISVAYAHPGHYAEGDVIGEMVTPALVDLLDGETVVGVGGGITGRMQSAQVSFEHDAVGPLDGAVAVIEGRAERDGVAVDFAGTVSPTDLAASDTGLAVISGCPVGGGELVGDAVVRLEAGLRLWLDQVDFGLVDGGELVPGEAPHNALARGMKKAASYSFAHAPL